MKPASFKGYREREKKHDEQRLWLGNKSLINRKKSNQTNAFELLYMANFEIVTIKVI